MSVQLMIYLVQQTCSCRRHTKVPSGLQAYGTELYLTARQVESIWRKETQSIVWSSLFHVLVTFKKGGEHAISIYNSSVGFVSGQG